MFALGTDRLKFKFSGFFSKYLWTVPGATVRGTPAWLCWLFMNGILMGWGCAIDHIVSIGRMGASSVLGPMF